MMYMMEYVQGEAHAGPLGDGPGVEEEGGDGGVPGATALTHQHAPAQQHHQL